MSTTRAVLGLTALAAVSAMGAWYCGGEVEETSTTTTTLATPGPAAPAPPNEVVGAAPNVSARVQTPAPRPQVPQPPCTSCPTTTLPIDQVERQR